MAELTNYFESNTSRANGYVLFTIDGAEDIEITLDETTSQKAMACINRMFEVGNKSLVTAGGV